MSAISRCLIMLGLLVGATAHGQQIAYDTITGNIVSGSGEWYGYNPGACCLGTYVVADQFTPSATGYISSLEASMFAAGSAVPETLSVYSDNTGLVGSPIETLTVTTGANWLTTAGNFSPTVNPGPFASGTYTSGAVLNAGQTYWLVTPDVSSMVYWESMALPGSTYPLTVVYQPGSIYANYVPGMVGSLGDVYAEGPGGNYVTGSQVSALGLQVTVSPVPEVSMAWLMLGGLGVLVVYPRRTVAENRVCG